MAFVIQDMINEERMISLNLRRITCAKQLQDATRDAMALIEDSLTPSLPDMGLIQEMYDHFKCFLAKQGKPLNANNRKKFLFVAVYLFCPSVLIGHTMPRGFRDKIKELINAKSATVVSNDVANLLFFYNCYRDFREDVDAAYTYIAGRMNIAQRT